MKKLVALVAVLLVAVTSFAQITEGKVKYNVGFNSPDPEVQAQLAMVAGSTMTMYFSPEFNRTEMNMGMFMQTTTVASIKSKESIILMSGMMGKKGTKMTPEADNEETEDTADLDIEKTSQTKKIAGYKCTKYVLTTENGDVVNLWTTEELSASKEGLYVNSKVQGFPLEFEVVTQGMTMTFTATEVEKNLKGQNKKELFSMEIPSDYEVVSSEDWKGMGM